MFFLSARCALLGMIHKQYTKIEKKSMFSNFLTVYKLNLYKYMYAPLFPAFSSRQKMKPTNMS